MQSWDAHLVWITMQKKNLKFSVVILILCYYWTCGVDQFCFEHQLIRFKFALPPSWSFLSFVYFLLLFFFILPQLVKNTVRDLACHFRCIYLRKANMITWWHTLHNLIDEIPYLGSKLKLQLHTVTFFGQNVIDNDYLLYRVMSCQ